jgi:hypothetical protein
MVRKTPTVLTAAWSALLSMLILTGCQTAHVSEPLTHTITGDDADAQLEFWHQLETRSVTCNDDAFHGLILYLDQSDPNTDYVSRVSALKSRGLLPADFNRAGEEAISRGTLAVAISNALKIKGGMMMHLAPNNGRYATRELVYMDLYPPSTPNQTFSGAEFLGIIGRIEDYQRGDQTDLPAQELPK